MKIPCNALFRRDRSAMEEIGFIYVFALSVLLLSAIFYTIRDSTSVQKERATKTYLGDQVRLISGIIQDVIYMQLSYPEMEYSRILDLRAADKVYQFRIEFTRTTITLISRFEEISATVAIYNPAGLELTPQVESDASAILIHYDSIEGIIEISPVNPNQMLR